MLDLREKQGKRVKFDYLIFIARFQPFHLSHEAIIKQALKRANQVIILVASSFSARSFQNPWSFKEREEFIRSSFSKEENNHIVILPLRDHLYSKFSWIYEVEMQISKVIKNPKGLKGGLIVRKKNKTLSCYEHFSNWKRVKIKEPFRISSNAIKEAFFEGKKYKKYLPADVAYLLEEFKKTKEYKELAKEYKFIKKYKKAWECAPYEPTFVTVDAIVVQAGHILLIKRKNYPGKGLLALPGGFIEPSERLEEAVLRELQEETKIALPLDTLRSSIKQKAIFDAPYRSARGRIITQAYLFELTGSKLAKVKGSDDAKEALWIPFKDIKSQNMFEDHFDILEAMLSGMH